MINKTHFFWQRMNEFQAADPDSARRGRLLNILLAGMFTLSIFALIAVSVILTVLSTWGKSDNKLLLVIIITCFAGSLGLFIINQHKPKNAALLFLLFLSVASVFSDLPKELANGRTIYIFLIPIAISSLLLSPASSFFFAIGNSIAVVVLANIAGVVPNIPAVLTFFFVALISWLSSRSLEQALKDLREVNLNLDKLVEQKTQELAATLSRELVLAGRNQAILDSIADGVIVFDANHASILANPALSQITGIPLNNMTGIQLSDFVKTDVLPPASQGVIMGLIEHPEKTEAGVRVEWGRKTLSLSVARVHGGTANANIGAVAVFRDITNEAELEKMKETFVAIVSHELRTPLNAIMGYAEMIKEAFYGPINEKQASATERIMVNTNRMLSMVGDLLDEAQLKAGKLSIKNESFRTDSLLKTMHSTMDKITTDKGIYLTDELDPDMPETITGDAQRLHQIIVNLVNNAAKFTSTGGIHVRVMRSDPDYWQIEVTDTGMGIPENEIPYIFETFRQVEQTTTRKHGGFGLGLAIVKQLIELMKGSIAVKSKLDKGSTFTVRLPLQ